MYFKFFFSYAIIASMYFISANAAPCPCFVRNSVPTTAAPTWGGLVKSTLQKGVCMVNSGLQTGAEMARILGSAISDASGVAYDRFTGTAFGKTVAEKVNRGTDYVKSAGGSAYDTIKEIFTCPTTPNPCSGTIFNSYFKK